MRVEEIRGERGAFDVRLTTGSVQARRILLCPGMIDELPEIDGFRAVWGTSIFQCPYCHGWEIQNQRFGYLAPNLEALTFPLRLRGWTGDVSVLIAIAAMVWWSMLKAAVVSCLQPSK